MQTDYENLLKYDKKWQNAWPSPEQVEFLFVRSSYRDIPELGDAREAIRFYTNQAEKHWNQYSLISKGEIALLMHRNGKKGGGDSDPDMAKEDRYDLRGERYVLGKQPQGE